MFFDPFILFNNKDKCPSCGSSLRWGVTTSYDEDKDAEICNVCKTILGDCKDDYKDI